jgi:hypothetical protein
MRFSQAPSVFLEHHFRGLNYDLNGITRLEGHFFGASPSDDALDEVFPNADDDVCHNATKLDFFDGSLELIASRESHATSLIQLPRRCEALMENYPCPADEFTDCRAPRDKDDSGFDILD